ncbi:hypothetical protein QP868_10765 [Brevibacterium sp. UMB1308A]|uniref:hypothetical protein n=1 Tax=Brevibacterium sp. UMB1308A TaxID=3050608 RepID=UPI0025511E7C|nr:hypothetical protein [Brevibacterium sp. UMB1308A]MDK8347444.1 hypothetical protein [Brevibacterium sp. UMB1308B]MDK8714375.1 hypothetical protein [Brevibacterium sp. UMB1308A]
MFNPIQLISHVGARFQTPSGDQTIRFGDSAEQVCEVLGQPEDGSTDSTLYFHAACIQVHLGSSGVEFMEFGTNPTKDGVDVELEGHNLSRMNAIECAEMLMKLNDGARIDESEAPASYAFEKLGVTIWQPYALQDALDGLREAETGGNEDELESLKEDVDMAEFFDSVGIGSQEYMKGYFS